MLRASIDGFALWVDRVALFNDGSFSPPFTDRAALSTDNNHADSCNVYRSMVTGEWRKQRSFNSARRSIASANPFVVRNINLMTETVSLFWEMNHGLHGGNSGDVVIIARCLSYGRCRYSKSVCINTTHGSILRCCPAPSVVSIVSTRNVWMYHRTFYHLVRSEFNLWEISVWVTHNAALTADFATW